MEFKLKDILFKRYGDPLSLLRTHSLASLADYILYLFDKDVEDSLWETWLQKEYKKSFPDFKKEHYKDMYRPKNKLLSKEEEQAAINNAMKFIKPVNKGGEIENE
jgi:hypothetical protein